ncbi:MAG TPA: nitronate monooxygenase family protein [Acidimicrobiales bacterium]|nr:nitronate monooxygenase family protein [Acidimicrobiales bacterium]
MSRDDVLRTRICELLGIEVPVLSAGMGFVARAELAAAVSNAGGLGVVGGAGMQPERLRLEIQRCRDLTDKPFGVDLLLPAQTTGEVLLPRPPRERPTVDPAELLAQEGGAEFAVGGDGMPVRPEELMQVVLEEEPPVFASGLGNPGPWVRHLHERGTKVLALLGNVKNARRVNDAGVDALVAQGGEAGGHTGRVGLASLVPAVVDAVHPSPVIAAGGISDGNGLAAALALGASGVWMGTRFVATLEAHAHSNYKAKIVEAGEDSTIVTRSYSGKPLRVIRNQWTDDWESRPQDILPFPRQFRHSASVYVIARRDGNTELGSMPCGQGAAKITGLEPAADVVHRVVEEARKILTVDLFDR